MSTRKLVPPLAAFAAVAATFPSGADETQYGFAEPASAADIALAYLSIQPDGANLPEGSGTAADGEPIYQRHCASCHGANGEGGLANRLVGGRGTLADDEPVRTLGSFWPVATTVFNYTRRAMPYLEPMSLSNDDYYALTAWMLNKNDIIAADTVIDKESLPKVAMPNRDGFVNAYPDVPGEYDYLE